MSRSMTESETGLELLHLLTLIERSAREAREGLCRATEIVTMEGGSDLITAPAVALRLINAAGEPVVAKQMNIPSGPSTNEKRMAAAEPLVKGAYGHIGAVLSMGVKLAALTEGGKDAKRA